MVLSGPFHPLGLVSRIVVFAVLGGHHWSTIGRQSLLATDRRLAVVSGRTSPHPLHFDRVGGRYVGGGAFLGWTLVPSFHIRFHLYYERVVSPHWWSAPFGRRQWP